jgi:hypothetical protein
MKNALSSPQRPFAYALVSFTGEVREVTRVFFAADDGLGQHDDPRVSEGQNLGYSLGSNQCIERLETEGDVLLARLGVAMSENRSNAAGMPPVALKALEAAYAVILADAKANARNWGPDAPRLLQRQIYELIVGVEALHDAIRV